MLLFPYFPEIKFLSVICVHFPPTPTPHVYQSVFTMIINSRTALFALYRGFSRNNPEARIYGRLCG